MSKAIHTDDVVGGMNRLQAGLQVADGNIRNGELEFEGSVIVNDLFIAIEANGWSKLDRFDTNGWDWDWWEHFTKDDTTICVHGSGYYGGVRIWIDEDE